MDTPESRPANFVLVFSDKTTFSKSALELRIKMASDTTFDEFTIQCNLTGFTGKFVDEGVSRIEDIDDLTKSKLTELGLTETQLMRLFRYFSQWKDKRKVQVKVNKDLERTEDSKFSKNQDVPQALKEKSVRVTKIQSEHSQSIREKVNVPLGHGFFNILGGSSVPVDKSKLQKLYKELWHNTPNNLKQELSSSFILEMSQANSKFRKFYKPESFGNMGKEGKRKETRYSSSNP